MRGMIEDAKERQKAFKSEDGQCYQHTCQKHADTSKTQRFPTRMTFIASALCGVIEEGKERQNAH